MAGNTYSEINFINGISMGFSFSAVNMNVTFFSGSPSFLCSLTSLTSIYGFILLVNVRALSFASSLYLSNTG